MNFKTVILFLVLILGCNQSKNEYRQDLMEIIDSTGYDGCFIVRSANTGKTIYVNQARVKFQFSPASTFKIPNSLIALQTRSVSSIHDTIRYNGIEKPVESWNRDHDLESAFKNSVVWYYQDIAIRIGDTLMKKWLDTITDYGTMVRAGMIDNFWLDGSLVISAEQQVNFLEKLYKSELPFSKEVMDTVKRMMLFEEGNGYKIYGKTGLSDRQKVGWFVGWIEKDKDTHIFATNISYQDTLNINFQGTRVNLTKKMLNKLRILN
ncbi:MAG: class D beta-lactamase [Candidatus Kapabacteria bacterium]|nr:class D beta-lactamase [Ignavibacteriota bacterium]MCW5884085.1 class D beta-lactamase [Candidatus Kapabacteria bacterium]